MANKTFSVNGYLTTSIKYGEGLRVEIEGEVHADIEEKRLLIESLGVGEVIRCLQANFEKELMGALTGGALVEQLCKWPKFEREKYIKILKARD